ncbi:MAG: hypothetical protein HQK56_20335, partial [Deltaproteobacteria bacterium]|nr:hypothetical protein [Deltaproteobacteria bacterium]
DREGLDESFKTLNMLADQAGLALENARLYRFIREANLELRKTRTRLLESEKMTALGEMAAGMAHEIRNPLTALGGFTRRIHQHIGQDSPFKIHLDMMVDEVERLEKTLKSILDFSLDTDIQFSACDLGLILDDALKLAKKDLENSSVTLLYQKHEIPQSLCDYGQIRYALYNILVNACQAMKDGGELRLKLDQVKEGDRTFAVCEIADTGGGIAPEQIHNIFNPFFTTKDYGTGLGLSIVHKVITRHKGRVDVENSPGAGVKFVIYLPTLD